MDFGGAKLMLFLGDRLVVIERDHTPGIPWPGHFDLPGGGREGAESPVACVLREVREEIGLTLGADDLRWTDRLGQGVFFAAHRPASLAERIVFGNEGLGWHLMQPSAFVTSPRAIPHFAMMVARYLETGGGNRFGAN